MSYPPPERDPESRQLTAGCLVMAVLFYLAFYHACNLNVMTGLVNRG
jgi:hypothetical protein